MTPIKIVDRASDSVQQSPKDRTKFRVSFKTNVAVESRWASFFHQRTSFIGARDREDMVAVAKDATISFQTTQKNFDADLAFIQKAIDETNREIEKEAEDIAKKNAVLDAERKLRDEKAAEAEKAMNEKFRAVKFDK